MFRPRTEEESDVSIVGRTLASLQIDEGRVALSSRSSSPPSTSSAQTPSPNLGAAPVLVRDLEGFRLLMMFDQPGLQYLLAGPTGATIPISVGEGDVLLALLLANPDRAETPEMMLGVCGEREDGGEEIVVEVYPEGS